LEKVVESWNLEAALATVAAATVSPLLGEGTPAKPDVYPVDDEIPF
jgi:hypothetical protein